MQKNAKKNKLPTMLPKRAVDFDLIGLSLLGFNLPH